MTMLLLAILGLIIGLVNAYGTVQCYKDIERFPYMKDLMWLCTIFMAILTLCCFLLTGLSLLEMLQRE